MHLYLLIVLISFVRCAQRNNSKCPQLPSHPDPRQLPSSSWPSEAPAKEDLLLIIPEAIRIHNDLHYIDYMTISIQICSLQNPITRYQSKSSICFYVFSVSFAKRQLQPSPRTTAFRQAPLHRTSSARHGAARRRWRVPGPLDSWGHTDQKNICQEPFFWGSIMFYDVPCYVSSL